MKCPKCGRELDVMVDITVSIPSSMYRNISKKDLGKKGVELWGVNWGEADFICPECGLLKEK